MGKEEKKKVKLNIMERLVLMDLLPKESNYITLKIMRETKEDVTFNEEELKRFEIKHGANGMITWKDELSLEEKEFEFGDVVLDIIKIELNKLDGNGKLEEKHTTLYEKFIVN